MNLPLPLFADSCPASPRPGPPMPLPQAGAAAAVSPAPFFMASPEALHPALWRAHQLGGGREAVTPSGFAALDAQLPGGGWPHGVLTELLLPHPGVGEMRLLAPALAGLAGSDELAGAERAAGRGGALGAARRGVMLFDPPAALCGWALGQLGLDARQWLVVQGRAAVGRAEPGALQGGSPAGLPCGTRLESARQRPDWGARWRRLGPAADVLWALEQALKSGHLGAAMAWLPAACKADVLRRLQLAAQAHDGPLFVFRELEARSRPSVAPLRLLLAPAGLDTLALRILKRRGPALVEPLRLALPPVLTARQRERAWVGVQAGAEAGAEVDAEAATPPPVWPQVVPSVG